MKGAFTRLDSSRADGTAGAAAARVHGSESKHRRRPRSRRPETRATYCATTRTSSRPTPDTRYANAGSPI